MIKITFYVHHHLVLPRVESDKTISTKITLSRKGKGCRYVPQDFKYHDDHAPSLVNTQEKQDYINRVTKAILTAWKKAKKEEE